MKKRKFFLCSLILVFLAIGCSQSNQQAALDKAADDLQAALEAKDTNRVLDMLHENFSAQAADNDKEWARRTMTGLFLRYKNIKIVALNVRNEIDEKLSVQAISRGEVALVGADGLIQGNASHYRVEVEWRYDGGQWKVIHIKWQ